MEMIIVALVSVGAICMAVNYLVDRLSGAQSRHGYRGCGSALIDEKDGRKAQLS